MSLRDELLHADLATLERVYATSPLAAAPRGVWRGRYLRTLRTPGARRPEVRLLDYLLFERTPFGIDFDVRRWWFWLPLARIGRFEISEGPSRWRDCQALRLTYGASRLPGPVRDQLYDEVRPLAPDLCLGLGGLNRDVDQGDHFFFLLEPAGRLR